MVKLYVLIDLCYKIIESKIKSIITLLQNDLWSEFIVAKFRIRTLLHFTVTFKFSDAFEDSETFTANTLYFILKKYYTIKALFFLTIFSFFAPDIFNNAMVLLEYLKIWEQFWFSQDRWKTNFRALPIDQKLVCCKFWSWENRGL